MTSTTTSSKLFTMEEVSCHNSRNDCWVVIHSKVYDVSKFLEEHPGGEEVLFASTGKDATSDYDEIGHSDTAKALMKTYYVGDIDITTIPVEKKHMYNPPTDHNNRDDNTSDLITRLLQFLLPLFILALAFGVCSYDK